MGIKPVRVGIDRRTDPLAQPWLRVNAELPKGLGQLPIRLAALG